MTGFLIPFSLSCLHGDCTQVVQSTNTQVEEDYVQDDSYGGDSRALCSLSLII